MRKILKSSLSFLLSILLILSAVPFVSAEAVPVDLIHDTDGDLREGVYFTSNKAPYQNNLHSNYSLKNVYDGDEATSWTAQKTPSATTGPFTMVAFPVAQQITEIKVKVSSVRSFTNTVEVRVSNDPTFASYTPIGTSDGTTSWNTFTVSDINKYRYVQVIAISGGWGACIAEVSVSGYLESVPTLSANTNLAAGDLAFATADSSSVSIAQKTIDGNADTYVLEETAVADKYIQLDLKKAAEIDRIDVLPTTQSAARQYFKVMMSNSATFETSETIYHREQNAVPSGETILAYSQSGTPYRYIRIQKSDTSTGALGIKEIKVWGTYSDDTVIQEVAKTATKDDAQTTDANYDTVWTGSETTYTFASPKYVTSVAFMGAGSEAERSGFKVFGSVLGDFSDEVELLNVTTPVSDIAFTEIALEADKIAEYRSVKIKTDATVSLNEVRMFYDVRETQFKVNETIPADGQTSGITNLNGACNFIEVEFNRPVTEGTVTPANVIIKNTDTDTVLQGWMPYSVDGKVIKIDISALSSDTNYTVTLTTGVKSGSILLNEETSFSFKTGTIFNVPYTPGKKIVNVAYKKAVVKGTSDSKAPNMLDGTEPTGANHHVTISNPDVTIDLGNFYDVIGVYFSEYTNYSLLNGIQIMGGDKNQKASEMTTTLGSTPATGTPHKVTLATEKANVRYVGFYRSSSFVQIKEFSVYALVDVDFGIWSAPAEITDSGEYTFSLLVKNCTESVKTYYMLVAAYDSTGAMQDFVAEPVTAAGGAGLETDATLSASVTANSDTAKITAILVDNLSDLTMLTDAKTIIRPVSE